MNEFLEVMECLPAERQKELQELFHSAPYWLLEEFHACTMPKNKEFITAGKPANMIYILLEGKVKAADLHHYSIVYDYTSFEPVHVFGTMEFYMGYENYITTLITGSQCKMLRVSKDLYVKWLMSDTDMLLGQVRTMLRDLNDQSQKERYFILLSGTGRLCYIIEKMYKRHAADGLLTIRATKEELANMAGTDIRTVNRAIKKLTEEELLTKKGRSLLANEEQYEKISEILQTMIEKNGGIRDGKRSKEDHFGL